jgi:hypothetical protein
MRARIGDVWIAYEEEALGEPGRVKQCLVDPMTSMSARRACGCEAPYVAGFFTCGSRAPIASQSTPDRHSA